MTTTLANWDHVTSLSMVSEEELPLLRQWAARKVQFQFLVLEAPWKGQIPEPIYQRYLQLVEQQDLYLCKLMSRLYRCWRYLEAVPRNCNWQQLQPRLLRWQFIKKQYQDLTDKLLAAYPLFYHSEVQPELELPLTDGDQYIASFKDNVQRYIVMMQDIARYLEQTTC